jgi:SIR2-like domain
MPGPVIDPFVVLAASLHYDRGAYAVLVGSGMSTAAGIPTGWDLTRALAELEARHQDGRVPDDIEAWWAANKTASLGYSSVMEAIAPTVGQRQALLRSLIEPSADEIRAGLKVPGAGHHALAELVGRGYVRVIVTTNFDRLLETALRSAGIEEQMLSGPGDLLGMIPLQHTACTVIKLHGDYQQANLINTDAELAEYHPGWLGLLRRVLTEYGLVTVGWSGQSDTALRREIVAAAGRRYGCFLGIRGELIPELQTLAGEGRATVVPVTSADEFFDKVAGTLTEVAHRPTVPLRTSAVVGTVKRLISQGRVKIELRDVVLREAGLLKDRLERIPAFSPDEYTQKLADIQQAGQPLAAALAAGCFYAPQERRLWIDLFRLISAQPQPMTGYAWHQGQALRRLPAAMALYAGVLGAWAAGDAALIKELLLQPVRYSYLDTGRELQQLPSCPAVVALAPPEVIDSDALGYGPGAYHASNKIVEAIMPVLQDEFPVGTDFAAAFEEAEYLMALLQHHWHETAGRAGHQRWGRATFHSGLIGIPGAFAGPQPEPVASRFDSRPGGLDIHSFAAMFGGDEESLSNSVAAVAEYLKDIAWR